MAINFFTPQPVQLGLRFVPQVAKNPLDNDSLKICPWVNWVSQENFS